MVSHIVTFVVVSTIMVQVNVAFCDIKIGNLLLWLQSKGAFISPYVEIADLPEYGLSMRSTASLNAGTVISRTPLASVLSLEHAYLFPEFQPVMDGRLSALGDTDLSALFLAYLRLRYAKQPNGSNEESILDWSGYINSLPRDVGLPVQFEEELFEEMRGSAVQDLCRRRNKATVKSFNRIRKVLSLDHVTVMPELTEEVFLWGLSIVWSRTHRVRAKDPDGQWQVAPALVPIADIFNMASSAKLANVECSTDADSKNFQCTAVQSVPLGGQLFVLYSSPAHRHNGRLLMDYGFCLRPNPWNQLTFTLPSDVPRQTADYESKHAAWTSIGPWRSGVLNLSPHSKSKEPDVSFELLAIGRLFNLNTQAIADLLSMAPQERYAFLMKPAASRAVEVSAVRWAKKALTKSIQAYRTTLVEDEALLDDANISSARRNIVRLRTGEKEILSNLVESLEHYQQVLDGKKSKRTKKRKEEL